MAVKEATVFARGSSLTSLLELLAWVTRPLCEKPPWRNAAFAVDDDERDAPESFG